MLKAHVLIGCVLVLAGCRYNERDVGSDEGGDGAVVVPAGPPTAIIRSAAADTGALYVPLTGDARLSGVDSVSADGTPLATYAWTCACLSTTIDVDLGHATLIIDSASVTDGCAVSLTVTDQYGRTDTASATLQRRDVGGYVSNHDCLAAYDAALTTPQGTTATPFCTIGAALDAVKANAIADVYVDATEFIVSKTNQLPAVRYHGGYARDMAAGTWTLSSAVPTLLTGSLSDANAPFFELIDHGDTLVTNFTLRRSSPCTGDCAMVAISGTHATLSSITLSRIASSDWDNPSPGRNVAIAVSAADDAWPTTLDGTGLTVNGDAGDTGIGILAAGRVTVDLKEPTIRPGTGGSYSFGIRATDSATIRVHDGGIIGPLDNPGHPKVAGYAIATGRTSLLPGFDSCSTGTAVCDGAAEVTVSESTGLDVKHVLFASAVAVAGATNVALTRVAVSAEGGSAEAVRTLGAASVAFNAAEVKATYLQDTSSTTRYAIGFHDGAYDEASDTYALGSSNVSTSTGTKMVATMLDYPRPIDRLIGMELMKTSDGSFSDTLFRAQGPANNEVTPGEAIGASLFETSGLVFKSASDKNTFNVESIKSAIATVAAFTDGDIASAAHGSTGLLLDGNTFDAPLAGTTTATNRVCAAFHGTSNSILTGGYFVCKAQIAETTAVGSYTNLGAWLQATDSFTIEGVDITFDYFVNTPMSPGSSLTVPILDGPLPTNIAAPVPSNNLLINRAHIGVHSYNAVRDVGIWLRGPGTVATRARIFNSQVSIDSRSGTDAVIAVERVPAMIAFNTLRAGLCGAYPSPCYGTSVGLELVRTQGLAIDVTANYFTVQQRNNSTVTAPAILDVVNNTTEFGIATLKYNAWGGDTNAAGDNHELYRRHVQTNDGTIVEAPASADATRSKGDLEATYSGAAVSNENHNPLFCGATDNITTTTHGTNYVPRPDPTDASYGALLVYDTNDALRQTTGFYDIGANLRCTP